jgi:calcium-dependent protein kinase
VSQLLTNSEKIGLEEIFKKADSNCDGIISPAEFKEIMKGRIKDEDRLLMIMRMMDLDGSGKIEYTEFLIAAMNPKSYLKREHYERAFEYFDIDHSGDISY